MEETPMPEKKPFPWKFLVALCVITVAISSLLYVGYQVGKFNTVITDQTMLLGKQLAETNGNVGVIFSYINKNVVPLINSAASSTKP